MRPVKFKINDKTHTLPSRAVEVSKIFELNGMDSPKWPDYEVMWIAENGFRVFFTDHREEMAVYDGMNLKILNKSMRRNNDRTPHVP